MSARTVAGAGSVDRLGELAKQLQIRHALVVSDPDIPQGDAIARHLSEGGIQVTLFREFGVNPDSRLVATGSNVATEVGVDGIVAVGGGSSLDCAKAINFLYTNGGNMRDYQGYGKATKPMLPMIGIPTTTGTGSEAQSYAVVSDAETGAKMACGDPKASFALVILDPDLPRTAPRAVRAAAGFDAISHAVETFVSTRRSSLSLVFTREAWKLLHSNYERSLDSDDLGVHEAMQTGSYLAGLAIENSMLGAGHACANPLTKNYGTTHAHGLSVMLPHAVRWNASREYAELRAGDLSVRLRQLANSGKLPATLRELGVPEPDLPRLAQEAAAQWTGSFNPRPFDVDAALELYRCAY